MFAVTETEFKNSLLFSGNWTKVHFLSHFSWEMFRLARLEVFQVLRFYWEWKSYQSDSGNFPDVRHHVLALLESLDLAPALLSKNLNRLCRLHLP